MDIEQFLHNEENRKDVYKYLSQCYYLPGENISAQVNDLTEALKNVAPEIAELTIDMGDEIDLELLRIDFSRLFVGPFKLLAPPYGSVYLEPERRVMGNSTMDARNRYREAGLGFSDHLREAPDHIAIELEFVYYLIFKEIEAFACLDETSVSTFWNEQKGFLDNHLGAWVSQFTEAVEKSAETDFYKNLARVTRQFVLKDKAKISQAFFAELAVGFAQPVAE